MQIIWGAAFALIAYLSVGGSGGFMPHPATSELQEFLESKGSPIPAEELTKYPNWKMIVALSAAESGYGKHTAGENNGWASSKNLSKFAQEISLDMIEWSECVTNGSHSQTILASNEDAKSLKITGTPAFFVIGPDGKTTRIFGAQPFEAFEKIFEIELQKLKN